jgi:hypothetical protein
MRAKGIRTAANDQKAFEASLRAPERDYWKTIKKTGVDKDPAMQTALDGIIRGMPPKWELDMLNSHLGHAPNATYRRLNSARANKLFRDAVSARKGLSKASPETQKLIDAYEAHAKLNAHQQQMLSWLGYTGKDLLDRSVLHHKIWDEMAGRAPRSSEDIQDAIFNTTGFKPLYTPDSMIQGVKKNSTRQNTGALFRAGARQVDPKAMIGANVSLAKKTGAVRAQELMLRNSIRLEPGQHAPHGFVYLKSEKTGEGFIQAHKEQFHKEMSSIMEGADPSDVYRESLTTGNRPEGVAYAVPKGMAQELEAQRSRSILTLNEGLKKGTQLWKGVTLGLRPAFITGNIVGNQILYHLQTGLRGIPGLAKTTMHAEKDLDLLNKYFPQRMHTFGDTEKFLSSSRKAKLANSAYHVVHLHEKLLSAAVMRSHLGRIPEFKQILKANKGNWDKALEQTRREKPWILKETDSVLDDTLGNYQYYNKFEQTLKDVMPFYGWNRHAMRAYYRLILNNPKLADTLVHTGDIGQKINSDEFPNVPAFMKSYLKLGGHTLDTRSLNPLSTAGDTTQALAQLAGGKPGQAQAAVSNLNPLLTSLMEAATGKSNLTGAPIKDAGIGPLTGVGGVPGAALRTAQALPPYKILDQLLGSAPPKKLLPTSTQDELLKFVGVPTRSPDLKLAQDFQKQLDGKSSPRKRKRKTVKPEDVLG